MRDESADALESTIRRLLEQCRQAFRSGNARLARQELEGAAALRRIVERIQS